jgi:hypothetical protein
MRARLLCLVVVLGATSLVPSASWACDSTGCLLLTRGQNGVMAKGTWRFDLSFRNTDQSDPRRGGDPATLVLRPKIYFEQERVIPAYHLDRDGRERFLQADVAYGLFDRTTVFLSLPAATQRAQDVVHGAVNTAYDIWGVGDGVIGLRQSLAARGALVGGLALKAPLAQHTLIDEYDQTILEPTLQPGSGAWSFVPSLQYSFTGLVPTSPGRRRRRTRSPPPTITTTASATRRSRPWARAGPWSGPSADRCKPRCSTRTAARIAGRASPPRGRPSCT